MTHRLPPSADLEFEKKAAKALLRAWRAADPSALERVRAHGLPRERASESAKPRLADAQLVIARERGFASWTKLKQHVESQQPIEAQAERFLAAIRDGKASIAKRLLSKNRAIGCFTVHTSAAVGDADAVAQFLTRDAKAFASTHGPEAWTPIHYLCASPLHATSAVAARRFRRTAEILLDAGADPNSYTLADEGDSHSRISCLYRACVGDQAAVVQLLLERGANPNDGESVYHSAQLNRRKSLALLLAHGVDVSSRHPHWNNTPLFFLAGHKENDAGAPAATEGMRWLLEHGADPNVSSYESAEMPLHRIAANGRGADVAEMFLAHGADPNLPRADGRTAYVFAVRAGNAAVAERLLAHGARADGVTPVDELIGACLRADAKRAEALIAENPKLFDRFTDEDRGAFADAANEGRIDAVRLMARLGFDMTWEATWAGTPLHHAAWRGNVDVVRLLVLLGAPVNARDRQFGSSPIAWAAHGSRFCRKSDEDYGAVMTVLLDAGADYASSINRSGEPPGPDCSPRLRSLLKKRGFLPGA
ncbi:MAG: ankyrin repeat domain-containing protein [Planctomycetes bacterium]|nr:ankyrin repeat domain-containing protein [Planctomycetota bacterium]